MCSADVVSDIARNDFFVSPTTNHDVRNDKRGFFTLPEELWLTTSIFIDL